MNEEITKFIIQFSENNLFFQTSGMYKILIHYKK